MKRVTRAFLTLLSVLTALAGVMAFAACGEKKVTLSFDTDGGTAVGAVEVAPGTEVQLPVTEKEGFGFEGWFSDPSKSGDPLPGTLTAPETDATYYAKWRALPAITLDLDGGSLEKTTLYLDEGQNVYTFMQDHIPTKTNRQFGEWLSGDEPLSMDAKMPAGGLSLKAHWKVPYTLEVYKQDAALENYVKDETLSVNGFGYTGEQIGSADTLAHFSFNREKSVFSVLEEKDDNVASAYYDREIYHVIYDANLPEGFEDAEGEMEDDVAPYETDVTVKDCAFFASGIRFLGWSSSMNGEPELSAGETISAIDRYYTFYAVWDTDSYADTLGGLDYLFRDKEDNTVVYLQRTGLPADTKGTVDGDGYFTFTGKDFSLKGKLDEGKKTFVYLIDAEQGTYVLLDSYLGMISYATELSVGAYGTASVSFYAPAQAEEGAQPGHGELLKKIDGTYALEDPHWSQFGIYTFHANSTPEEDYAQYAQFNFRTGEGTLSDSTVVQYFAIQGQEGSNGSEGTYLSIVGNGFGYPVLVTDGFGGCAYYATSDSDPLLTISYLPANYTTTYNYAAENEFVIVTSENRIYGLVRLSLTTGYNSQTNEPVDVGVLDINDGSTGPYDCTYTQDGETVTERIYMSGYGEAVYYGRVTVDSEGNESYQFELKCTYDPNFITFYPIDTEEDDESGDVTSVEVGNAISYNKTVFTDGDGNEYIFKVVTTPGYSFNSQTGEGTWTKGSISKVGETAGLYPVLTEKRVRGYVANGYSGIPENNPYYLYDWTLYITGAPNSSTSNGMGTAQDNYAEIWGKTGYVIGTVEPLERICSGNLLPTEEQTPDGQTIYKLTVTKANIGTSYGGYASGAEIKFYFAADGTAVFIETEQLNFLASDGATLTVDEFGRAYYTPADGERVSAELSLSEVGNIGLMYSFEAAGMTYDFFRPNTAPQGDSAGVELLGDIYTQDANNAVGLVGWNAGYRSSAICTTSQIVMLKDGKAILFVFYEDLQGGSARYRTYVLYGAIAETATEGVYQFTKTTGPSGTIPSFSVPFNFKYVGENGFAIYTNKLELNATEAVEEGQTAGTFVADGYGTATYTDANGAAHTGDLQLVLDYSKSAGVWGGSALDKTKGLYLYRIVEENGTVWNFALDNLDGKYDSASNRKTFRLAGEHAGVYWIITNDNGNGSMSSNYYFYDGLYVYRMSGNNSNTVEWIGSVQSTSETETGAIFKLKYVYRRYDTEPDTLKLALRQKAGASGREWHLAFTYDAQFELDYKVVDENGTEVGSLYGDGYDFMGLTYVDSEGVSRQVRVTDFNAEEHYITVDINLGDTYSTVTFDIREDGTLWERTSLAMEAYRTNRQLMDDEELLITDGHGNAVYKPNAETEITGKYEQIEGSVYSFTSDDGAISFRYTLYVELSSGIDGTAANFYFGVHTEGYEGYYYETESFTSLWLNDGDTATYYDVYGRVYSGNYNLLGGDKSLLEFYSDGAGYHYFHISYHEDGTPVSKLVSVEGDYAYIGNVIYGYQGGETASPLPAGVDTIGFAAFYNKPVVTIDLTGIVTLESYAFADCVSLQTVTGTGSLETVGDYAFYNCLKLSEINLETVKVIGYRGMGNTVSLAGANLNAIEEIAEEAFTSSYGAVSSIYDTHPKFDEVHIGSKIKHIGDHAFRNIHVFRSDGYLTVYLHTTTETDYDNLMGYEVFYQTEMSLYVDSLDVAKKIYASKMATQYRTTAAYEQYRQLIRIAGDNTDEYGYYIREDFSNTEQYELKIVRLDGMLVDAGGSGAHEYPNLAYTKSADGTLSLAYYDPSTGTTAEKTATVTKEGTSYKLVIDGRVWWRLSETEELVYKNGSDELRITGTVAEGTWDSNVNLNGQFTATLKATYKTGASEITSALAKTHKRGTTAGYLQMSATSKYTYRFALGADLTFTVPYAEDYFDSPNASATERIKVLTTTAADGAVTKTLSFGTNGKVSTVVGQLGQDVTTPRVYIEAANLGSTSNYSFVTSPTFGENSIQAHVKSKSGSTKDYEWEFDFTIDPTAHTYTVETNLIYGEKTFEGFRSATYGKDFGFKVILDSRNGETKMTGIAGMTYRNFGATTAFSNATSSVTKGEIAVNQWFIYSTNSTYKSGFVVTYTPAKDGAAEKLEVRDSMQEIYTGSKDASGVIIAAEGQYTVGLITDADGNVLNLYSFAMYYCPYNASGEKNAATSITGSSLKVNKTSENHFTVTATFSSYRLAASSGSSVTLNFELVYDPVAKTATVTLKDELIVREYTDSDGVVYRALFVKDSATGTVTLKHLEYKAATASSYTKATLNNSGAASGGSYSAYYGSGSSRKNFTVTLSEDNSSMTVTVA